MKALTHCTLRTVVAAALTLPITALAQETAANCASPTPGVIPSCTSTERLQDLSSTLSVFTAPASTIITTSAGNGIEANAARNWSLTNYGLITGFATGISLASLVNSAATFENFGSVVGKDGMGVGMRGGTLINHEAASILGTRDGVSMSQAGVVTNDGLIQGASAGANNTSVYFAAGGTFTQGVTGRIAGVHGVLFNAGTLAGSNAGSIDVTGNGLWARANSSGSFTNSGTINTTGAFATKIGAVRVQGGASLTLNGGGSIFATGNGAFGIYANNTGTSVTAFDMAVNTSTGASTGVFAENGAFVTLNGGSVSTSAAQARGMVAFWNNSSLTANNVAVMTTGDEATAVRASGAGLSLGVDTVTLNGGSVSTAGEFSYAVMATTFDTLWANNVTVTTSGDRAGGATSQNSGNLEFSGGSIATSGAGAAGLSSLGIQGEVALTGSGPDPLETVVEAPDAPSGVFNPVAANPGSSLIARDTRVTTSGADAPGASVRGPSSITIAGSTISALGAGAAALSATAFRTAGAGTATISNSTLSSAQAAGVDVNGTTLNATIAATTLSGATALSRAVGAGTLNLTADASTLSGAALTESGSETHYLLRNSTTWNVTGDSTLTALTLDAASVKYGGAFALGGAITLDSGGGSFDTNGFDATLTQSLSGAGALSKRGEGTLVLTTDSTYGGGTTIDGGTLQLGDGGTMGNVAGPIAVNGTLVYYLADAPLDISSSFSGSGVVRFRGVGVSAESSYRVEAIDSTFTGSFIAESDTRFHVDGAGQIESAPIYVENDATLFVSTPDTLSSPLFLAGDGWQDGSAGRLGALRMSVNAQVTGPVTLTDDSRITLFALGDSGTLSGPISDGGNGYQLEKTGNGTLIITGALSVAATTISKGTLQVGDGATSGSISGSVVNNAALVFNRSDALTYGDTISGSGTLTQSGSGTLTLSGASSYSGLTTVAAGRLRIDGSIDSAVLVNGAATLGGAGTIGGAVTIDDTGHLAPGSSVATLHTGDLLMGAGALLDYELGLANLPGGNANDLTVVSGNLTLDGVLNIADAAGFGAREVTGPGTYGTAVYRLFDYSGSLTDAGLEIGSIPAGFTTGNFTIDTATPGQVNLTVLTGGAVQFWDGRDVSPDGQVSGGSAIWTPAVSDWTNAAGSYNSDWQAGLAVFAGTAGVVTLGADIPFAGLVFATDGYRIAAGEFQLQSMAANTLVRVAAGSATIDASIAGATQLVKTGGGVLALGGENHFSGGIRIDGGAVQVAADSALGGAGAQLDLDNGTLITTSTFASTRNVALGADGGSLDTAAGTGLTLSGVISGAGELRKLGAGKLILGGSNGYAGGTVIQDGILQAGADAAFGVAAGAIDFDGGTLALGANFDLAATRRITLDAAGGRVDTNGFDTTVAQAIGGAGSLTKLGHGTLTLAADNTYAGATAIEAGTLRIGAGGTTGSVIGNIANDGALVFERSDASVFAGVVSGGGSLDKRGAGSLLLTADNTYTGGTRISAGALQLGNGGAAGGVAGDVVNNGALIFNRAGDFAFDGIVSGSGTLAQLGPGTLTLRGENTFTGATTIVTGGLLIGDGGTRGSLPGDVINNGTLIFNRSDALTYAGVVSGAGSLWQAGSGALILTADQTYTGGTTISAGTLQLGNGGSHGMVAGDVTDNGTLIFNRSDDLTFAATIAGTGGVTKLASNTLTLSGSSSYAGPTHVNAGRLMVHGVISSAVDIAQGATLGGNGTVGAINSAGTVSPGASIGALHVIGDFAQSSAATLQIEFDDRGHIDTLDAGGAAVLAGQVVYLPDAASVFGQDLQYTYLTAAGGVSGNFGPVTQDHAGVLFETLYTADGVQLRIDAVPIIDNIVTPGGNDLVACVASLDAQRSAVAGTRAAPTLNALVMTPVAALPATVHGICPRDPSVLPSSVDAQVNARFAVLANRLAQVHSGEGAPDGMLDSYQLREGVNFWLRGAYLDVAEDARDILRTGFDSHSDSLAMGIDFTLGESGVLGAYLVRDDLDLDYRAPVFVGGDSAHVEDRAWSTGLYGSYWSASRWFLQGILEYGWHDVESTRTMAVGLTGASAEGNRDAGAFAANVAVGYNFAPTRNWLLQPTLTLSYHRLSDDAYTETGADSLNLSYSSLNADTLRGEAGITARRAIVGNSSTRDITTFYAFANYIYDQPLDDRNRSAQFAIAEPFEVAGDENRRDGIHYGLGLENTWHGDTTLQLLIDAENYGGIETLGASLQFRRKF